MTLTKAQREVLKRMTTDPLIIVPPVGKGWSEPTRFAFRNGLCSHYINSRIVASLREKKLIQRDESILFEFYDLTDAGRKAIQEGR